MVTQPRNAAPLYPSRLKSLAAALALALSVAAEPPAVAEAPASGWTVHENKAAHFAIALPPGWNTLELDPAAIQGSLSTISAQNPDLGKAFGPQAQALIAAGFKFFAIDTTVDLAKVGFATNVNVLTEKMAVPMTIETNLEANAAQLKTLDSVRGIEKKIVDIGGKKAARMSYRMMINPAAGLEVAIDQVCFLVDQTSLIFTFTTLPSQSAHYDPVFEEMIARIKILG